MGCVVNVGYKKFPKQGSSLNKKVVVCFNYDTKNTISGTIVRDDIEEPFLTLIKLKDDQYIRGIECQYTVKHI